MPESDDPLIQAGHVRREPLNRKPVIDEAAARIGETLGERLVREKREDLHGQIGVVSRAMEQPGLLIDDDLGNASHLRGNDWRSLSHCLDDHEPESFEVGGKHGDIEPAEDLRNIVPEPGKDDVLGQSLALDQPRKREVLAAKGVRTASSNELFARNNLRRPRRPLGREDSVRTAAPRRTSASTRSPGSPTFAPRSHLGRNTTGRSSSTPEMAGSTRAAAEGAGLH